MNRLAFEGKEQKVEICCLLKAAEATMFQFYLVNVMSTREIVSELLHERFEENEFEKDF